MRFYITLGLLLALLVAVFAVQNATTVNIRFLAWQFKNISLAVVVLGSAAGGAFVVFILGVGREVRNAWRMRELSNQNIRLSQRLSRAEVQRVRGTSVERKDDGASY
ncbi:MAG: LapA family protein [Bacillota bacterium]